MSSIFVPDADWLDWDHHPTRPTFVLPPGSVDAHCHVFGPGDVFPYAPERRYTPTDAPKEQLFALRDFLGFERNVIVQATCHGSDNSALVDALVASNDRARGVATITPDIAEEELKLLHEAGVRAVRFNYVKRLGDTEPDEYYRRIVERITPLGWHVVVYFEAADLAERWDFFTHLETTVVVDHMGRPDVTKDPDGPEFAQFLRLMDEHPNVWSKVTCPDRLSVAGPPYDDVVPFARRVVERYPDRVLTGTDWPHPNLKTHMPDDGALVDFIPRIATTQELQRKLLVDNPLTLYWREYT
jgi:2-pyrone-4,6-dicarboxylate lactonase